MGGGCGLRAYPERVVVAGNLGTADPSSLMVGTRPDHPCAYQGIERTSLGYHRIKSGGNPTYSALTLNNFHWPSETTSTMPSSTLIAV